MERWGPYGAARNWEGGRFHGEGKFFPVNAGSWLFWLDTAEIGQEMRFMGTDVPSRWGRWNVSLGDFTVQDPRDDPLRIEFQETVWVRGAGTRLTRGPFSLGTHLGVLTRHAGAFGWGRDPLFHTAYGIETEGRWRGHHRWEIRWDRQDDSPAMGGLHLGQVLVGRRPPQGWFWMGQSRFSRLDASGALGESFIAGGGFTRPAVEASAHLRWISPRFQSLGLGVDPHRDEWGGRLEVSVRPRPQLRVGTSWDWARDVEPRIGLARPEERLFARLFFSSPLTGPLSAHGSVGYRNRSTGDRDSLLVDQHAMNWAGGLGWSTNRGSAEVDLSRAIHRDPTSLTGDWHEDRIGAHAQARVVGPFRADLHGWTANRRFLNGDWASRERKAELRLSWDPGRGSRGWISGGRDHQDAADLAFSRDQWEIAAGWSQEAPWGLTADLEALFFLSAGASDVDRTRLNLRVSRRFAMRGEAPPKPGAAVEFGAIQGWVYEDRNGNGRREPDEPGIAGQSLRLGSGEELVTGKDGSYGFKRAAIGAESVALDDARLPTRFLVPDVTRSPVSLRPGDTARIDFPVRQAAGVTGRVMGDLGNRAEGMPDVLLRVLGTHHDVFTDAEGRFFLPGLGPGQITLEVVEWSLPPEADRSAPRTRQVILRSGETTYAGILSFPIRKQEVLQYYRAR
jgi:hypothetical protein